jgi:hypothetical protein
MQEYGVGFELVIWVTGLIAFLLLGSRADARRR